MVLSRQVVLAVALVGATSSPFLHAQTRATSADLAGVVRDTTDAVLPGATVTATNTATNQARFATTDGEGRFLIPALPPGTYDVSATLSGFAGELRQGVTLALGSRVDLSFVLNVSGTAETITVSAPGPLLDAQRTVVASVVSRQQIESLPIDGRNFLSFAVITPGVNTDRTPQQGASATSGLTFAGQRARSNNITVDGLNNNDMTLGSVRTTFSQEAVREISPASGVNSTTPASWRV